MDFTCLRWEHYRNARHCLPPWLFLQRRRACKMEFFVFVAVIKGLSFFATQRLEKNLKWRKLASPFKDFTVFEQRTFLPCNLPGFNKYGMYYNICVNMGLYLVRYYFINWPVAKMIVKDCHLLCVPAYVFCENCSCRWPGTFKLHFPL